MTPVYDISNLTISSTHPCLIIYLVDQSGSMADSFGNAAHSKAVETANAINEVIYEIGLRCIGNNSELKNRFEVAVIGYGKNNSEVHSAWEGNLTHKWVVSIKDIFDHPLGIEQDKPVWIKPYANGATPMTKAFENARRLCTDWINWGNHRDCHPPIIINITDGEATDAESGFRKLKQEAELLKALHTNFGSAQVLNIHISSKTGDRQLFPANLNGTNDRFASLMYELSSPLSDNMLRIARQKGYQLNEGAKGYVYNGNVTDLINFVNIGTPQ